MSTQQHDATTTNGIDRSRWPDVATVPGSGVRARVAGALFSRAVAGLPLRVLLPDGRSLGAGGLDSPVMQLVRPDDFYRRVGATGLIGFGESYQAGDWTADDLPEVLTVFARRMASLVPGWLQRGRALYVKHAPRRERGTSAGARRNIEHHYDLSNDLFASFLDPSMTYSSALFGPAGDGSTDATWATLQAAQERKIDRLLDLAEVAEGTTLLEIGTGWGELALRAAARGAQVRSITLSQQQAALARGRIADAGLSDRVSVEICDYRDVTGTYDAVVSVEMIEAVGYDYWPAYFSVLHRSLRPGGRVALQAITMPHDRMIASRSTYTWIQKYIFPGGLIPSVQAIDEQVRSAGLRSIGDLAFGRHYADTLRLWRARFENEAGSARSLGFDETFGRMWSLYLAYSEAGFRSGYLDVHQIVLERPAGPPTAVATTPQTNGTDQT